MIYDPKDHLPDAFHRTLTNVAEVLRLKAEQVSHSEIARQLGIGRTSVRRILAAG
jgi:response regulator of citrate/malate metabolism